MRVWLNHAGRPGRAGREMLLRCDPGVVSKTLSVQDTAQTAN